MQKIIYFEGINTVDYSELDEWFSKFIKNNHRALLSHDIVLVKISPGEGNSYIKIGINDDLNVIIGLYVRNICCGVKHYIYGSYDGIGKQFLTMLLTLKKDIKN